MLQEPKSRAARRVVPLPVGVVEVLRAEHERTHPREPGPDQMPDAVLVKGDTSEPASIWSDSIAWRRLLDDCGLKDADLHSMRHTAATLMVLGAVDVRTVGGILGHSSLASTSAYLHAARGVALSALEGLTGSLVGSKAEAAREERRQAAALAAFEVDDPEPSWDDPDAHAAWRQRVVDAGLPEPPEPF